MDKEKQKRDLAWIGIGVNFTPQDWEYLEFCRLNDALVQKYGSTFVFDPVTNQPHLNLYDVDIPAENLDKIEIAFRR